MRIIKGVALKLASGVLGSGLPGSLQSQRGPIKGGQPRIENDAENLTPGLGSGESRPGNPYLLTSSGPGGTF